MASAVLVVDVAINVVRIGEINQLGARFKVAFVPALQAQSGIEAGDFLHLVMQIQQHELPRVQRQNP